ncbi:MAG: hypothetical protein ACR2IV_04375 [Bryobacteraceae bacterium]
MAVCLTFVSLPVVARASDTEFNRRTLKGIKAVGVIVEELKEVPNGLTKEQLQSDVELKLREAGITVIPLSQSNQAAAPYLYVRVNSIQLPSSGQYVYAIGIELNQVVRIARDMKITSVATTWDKGGTGCTSRPGSIRDGVADYVDKFLTAYFSVNPTPWRPY